MASRAQIDRKKHEVDVAEHVLSGGVRADAGDGPGAPVVALDIGGMRRWPFGVVASAVQVQVLADDEVSASSDRRRPADGRMPPAPPDHARRRWR